MNRESYNAIAAAWDEARRGFVGRERHYVDTLLEGLPARARVLDAGCGTGRPLADYILSRGHDVVGVDQSERLLELARARFPAARWVHSRLEDFAPAAGAFDAIVCWDALFHIPREHHETILGRFARALAPGGRLMLTAGGSAHPAFTDTMFGHEFFYDSHSPERLTSILGGVGFTIVIGEFMNQPTGGRDKGRYAIVAERRAG
jgi:cyclopropane fatty-acyl-phospholipid synthase-like methyltransferase